MSDQRLHQVVDVFVGEVKKSKVGAQVGGISLSTEQVIERLGYGHGLEIRSFQISFPSWEAVSNTEMLTFFETVCGESPDSGFLHYNLARAKRILDGDDYRMILDRVPNMVASKQNTNDTALIRGWMTRAPEMQHCMLQGTFGYARQFGEFSLLCSMHGAFPKLTCEYFGAGSSEKIRRVLEIAEKFNRHRKEIFGQVRRTLIDGARDKLLVWLTDPSFSRRLLPPYEGLTDEEAEVSLEYDQKHQENV